MKFDKVTKKEIIELLNKAKSEKDVQKIKRLAMHNKIKLGELRKKFCKNCYSLFDSSNCEVRVKNSLKIVRCLKCGNVSRYKIKTS
ncbi:MAG: hypothetical protein KKF56_01330 [Nanoarchaeota archaeon]|nr:hypothetical protein [Nanoarchaeota archaeon]